MNQELQSAGQAPASAGNARENNFTMIRLIATIFVFAGHMGQIRGGTAPLLGSFAVHQLGVGILFLMSGYLITKSWQSDPHPLRYGIRRFFRLWPPFAVMVLLMVFVAGPLVSNLGLHEYFESGWYTVYLKNLRFYIIYALPGVFTDLPISNVVNGSLWTMPVEAALYVLTPLLLIVMSLCGCKADRKEGEASVGVGHASARFYAMAVLTVLVCAFDLYLRVFRPEASVVFYATDLVQAYHLIVLYVIGMFFTCVEVKKYLNLQIASVAMLVLLLFQFSSQGLQYLMLYFIFPYFIFSLAFAPGAVFRKLCRKVEPSYGIYLYGFFFQQFVVSYQMQHGLSWGYLTTLLVSAVPTLVAAILSYYLVEMPMMRLSRYLISRIRKKPQRG